MKDKHKTALKAAALLALGGGAAYLNHDNIGKFGSAIKRNIGESGDYIRGKFLKPSEDKLDLNKQALANQQAHNENVKKFEESKSDNKKIEV
jgi:hypothetical protein